MNEEDQLFVRLLWSFAGTVSLVIAIWCVLS